MSFVCVLDSSALIASIVLEKGSDNVESAIAAGSFISSVNQTEVITKLLDKNYSEEEIRKIFEDYRLAGLKIVPFNDILPWRTALLRKTTKPFGLSLGDRACLATAQELQLPALTADRSWVEVQDEINVTVVLIR